MMNEELIRMINKALVLVYDTVHPMPKVEISQILSRIKTELSKEESPTEFTKEARKYMEHSLNHHWTDLAIYTTRACVIIEQLQATFKAQQSEKEKLVEALLRIDNYCRVNDIDLDRAMEDRIKKRDLWISILRNYICT